MLGKEKTEELAKANESIQTEITKRIRLEEALRQVEARYQAVFENSGTAMGIIDKDTTILKVNKEYLKLGGYSKDEVEGKLSFNQFISQEDLKRLMNYHKKELRIGLKYGK